MSDAQAAVAYTWNIDRDLTLGLRVAASVTYPDLKRKVGRRQISGVKREAFLNRKSIKKVQASQLFLREIELEMTQSG